jgi:hypothetical protein
LSRGDILLGFVFHHTDYKLRGGDIRVLSDKTDFASCCTSGEIDDEKYFLISCSTCPEIRTELFSRINNICQNFHVLNPEQKLYWLLNSENEEMLASICNLITQSTLQLIIALLHFAWADMLRKEKMI